MGRKGLAIRDAPDAEFLHQLERFDVLDSFTGNITAAIHLATVQGIQKGVRIPYAAGQE
jgi:hypothetical protein